MEILLPILIILAVVVISGFRIAQEYERAIVFRLGRYESTKGPGLYWIIPLIDRQQTIDIRTKTVDPDAVGIHQCGQKFQRHGNKSEEVGGMIPFSMLDEKICIHTACADALYPER